MTTRMPGVTGLEPEDLMPTSWPSEPVELLRALYPPLLATAKVLSRGRDPEDLVQQALVEMLVRYPQFEGISHPLGYAKTVVAHLAYRRNRSRASMDAPLDLLDQLEEASADGWEDGVGDQLEIREAMRRLGPKQRVCVYLRFAEGLDDQQIASVLGTKPSTVRSQISRGLRRMKEVWPGVRGEEA
jgi:RNA polymerase sigma factor (sigma-70 family)